MVEHSPQILAHKEKDRLAHTIVQDDSLFNGMGQELVS